MNSGLPVSEYSARQIKQAVVGTGSADKEQVQHMVMAMLRLNRKPQADAADGLAVALCHAHTRQGLINMAGTGGRKIVRGRYGACLTLHTRMHQITMVRNDDRTITWFAG